MSLEDRVKSLEEWRDAVVQAMVQAPKKQAKAYFAVDKLGWSLQPPTDKGEWERCEVSEEPQFWQIVRALEAAGKPLFNEGVLYWLLTDRETGRVTGLGRRQKR